MVRIDITAIQAPTIYTQQVPNAPTQYANAHMIYSTKSLSIQNGEGANMQMDIVQQ